MGIQYMPDVILCSGYVLYSIYEYNIITENPNISKQNTRKTVSLTLYNGVMKITRLDIQIFSLRYHWNRLVILCISGIYFFKLNLRMFPFATETSLPLKYLAAGKFVGTNRRNSG